MACCNDGQRDVGVVVQKVDVRNTSRDRPPPLGELRSRRDAIGGDHSTSRRFRYSRDVDLLVESEPGRSLFDLGGLLMDLRDLLEGPADVVTPAALQERVRIKVFA